jgi:hypothetical protein
MAPIVVSTPLDVCPSSQFLDVSLVWIPDCGNVLTPGTSPTSASQCNSPCDYNPDESCGGPENLDLYQSGGTPPPQPVVVEKVDSWYYVGCFRLAFFVRSQTCDGPVCFPQTATRMN